MDEYVFPFAAESELDDVVVLDTMLPFSYFNSLTCDLSSGDDNFRLDNPMNSIFFGAR